MVTRDIMRFDNINEQYILAPRYPTQTRADPDDRAERMGGRIQGDIVNLATLPSWSTDPQMGPGRCSLIMIDNGYADEGGCIHATPCLFIIVFISSALS